MDRDQFISAFSSNEKASAIRKFLSGNEKSLWINGLAGSSVACYAASVIHDRDETHLFILNDKEEAAYFLNDLQNILDQPNHLHFFPESSRLPYQVEKTDNANVVARAEVLEKINRHQNQLWIVTYPEAVYEKVIHKKTLREQTLILQKDHQYVMDELNDQLLQWGFSRVDFVYEPGQFSIRGGILDIFSFVNDLPYRIEFFDDEVDQIKEFDPVTQRSTKNMDRLVVVPNVENKKQITVRESFLEYIPEDTKIWCKDLEFTKNTIAKKYEKAVEVYQDLPKEVSHSAPADLFLNADRFETLFQGFQYISFAVQKPKVAQEVNFNTQPQPSFKKNFDRLHENLNDNKAGGFTNVILSSQAKQIERLYAIFEDLQFEVNFNPLYFTLHEGFIDQDIQLACYTDHQIFERYHRFKLKEGFREHQQALTIKELYSLKKGDYITHVDHGVGKFSGLEIIDVNGKPQEAIRLVYKDNDVLYVSIHSLHRISKFSGKDGGVPKMNKLGTQTWANLKKKTKKKVKEVAYDLIQLYAKRKAQPGFGFTPDTYLQNELEASFIYEDTPDQLKATQAIKEDMESDSPMDRLVCGDVGFGKTEVAIRAAFKAVADSKQVAVLVPTTILSLQHFKNFKNRLAEFPCKIDYLNRFKSQKKVTETLKKLEAGEIDIVIGTHKLVGKKVKFKDLGLIIVDEEQKFGVSVKDKLKTLRATVDTLTLTATPIPRTLQFSLMGARDLSIISTPPPNRQPVHTEVINFNEEQIRDVISYEVNRGGQVFFVHNRVQNIHEVAGLIQRLCPGIRIAIGHGQMDGEQLEKIMVSFIEEEYDLLLATTIIESGIDIPNANTILINDAQNFGISDLHQLRGRVGRSNKKAFCYLIAPPNHLISSDSRKRLEALVHFSDLGSGFNIAMKDLDIRGAGNLLGAEQSGFISDIGFDMYQNILKDALKELKENEFKDLFNDGKSEEEKEFVEECVFETDLELRIPDTYVNQVDERLHLYQKLDEAQSKEDLDHYREMMVDRFGPLPQAVEDLLATMEIRWMAKEIGITKLVVKSGKLIAYFLPDQESGYFQTKYFTAVLTYLQNNPSKSKMSEKNGKLRMIISGVRTVPEIKQIVEKIQSNIQA